MVVVGWTGLFERRRRSGLHDPEGMRGVEPVPAHLRDDVERNGRLRLPQRLPTERRRRELQRHGRMRHRVAVQSAVHQHGGRLQLQLRRRLHPASGHDVVQGLRSARPAHLRQSRRHSTGSCLFRHYPLIYYLSWFIISPISVVGKTFSTDFARLL